VVSLIADIADLIADIADIADRHHSIADIADRRHSKQVRLDQVGGMEEAKAALHEIIFLPRDRPVC